MPTPLKHTGFGFAGDDYVEQNLNLNKYLVKHPNATFFVKFMGQSIPDLSVKQGDILIIDKSANPTKRDLVIANINGKLKLRKFTDKIHENWGTVISIVRKL